MSEKPQLQNADPNNILSIKSPPSAAKCSTTAERRQLRNSDLETMFKRQLHARPQGGNDGAKGATRAGLGMTVRLATVAQALLPTARGPRPPPLPACCLLKLRFRAPFELSSTLRTTLAPCGLNLKCQLQPFGNSLGPSGKETRKNQNNPQNCGLSNVRASFTRCNSHNKTINKCQTPRTLSRGAARLTTWLSLPVILHNANVYSDLAERRCIAF